MEHEYLIFQKWGEDLVVAGLKDNAPNDIVIPDGVKRIALCAFAGCEELTSIVISDSVTEIADAAFVECTSLTSIVIPDSVKIIDEWAFEGCTSLTSIKIPNSVVKIGYGAFEGCTSLTSYCSMERRQFLLSSLKDNVMAK